jgi:hypothetical protein
MITVPQATEKIIKRSRYLTEAMAKNLINASSLARYIQPEVEKLVFKQVTRGSILMAIKRLEQELRTEKKQLPLFSEPPDMIVRSNLALFYVKTSPTLLQQLGSIEQKSSGVQKRVLFTYGRAETIILANKLLTAEVEGALANEQLTRSFENVSAITIHLPETSLITPGVLNLYSKSLAWEGVNLLGVLTTETELTLLFDNNDIQTAFGILQSLFLPE